MKPSTLRHLMSGAALMATLISCQDTSVDLPPPISPQANNAPQRPLERYTLKEKLEVLTDEHGVPHIYASNDLDLFYGAGYQLARERLFEIDVNRRAAVGTRAEVFGPSKIGGDIQAKTLRWGLDARESLALMAREHIEEHDLLIAYASGINAYIEEVLAGKQPLPQQFATYDYLPTPVSAAELLAIGLRINFGYSSQVEFDLLNTLLHKLRPTKASQVAVHKPGLPAFTMLWDSEQQALRDDQYRPFEPDASPAQQQVDAELSDQERDELRRFTRALSAYREDMRIGEGSNAWIINGQHSFNGRPIVANDSHASLNDPNALYLMHLNSLDAGGSFNVMGFGFVGVPAIQLGHNHKLAWAATTNFADMMDLWEVSLKATDQTIKLGGKDYPVVRRKESFRVRGQADQQLEVVEVPGLGVILPESFLPVPKLTLTRRELLLAYPGFKATDELRMFTGLDRAQSLEEFEAAIDVQKVGMQNWHGATKDGMRYRTSGQIPDRGKLDPEVKPDRLMDGSNPKVIWSGQWLPPERLPKLDGSQPFHISANNDPWGHTADNDPLNDEFYYGSFYAPGYRAGRLLEALREQTAQGKITVEQTQALQLEVASNVSPQLIPLLEQASQKILMTPSLEAFTEVVDEQTGQRRCKPALCDAVDRLVAWDHQMTKDSQEGLLFRLWLSFLSRRTLEDDLGDLLFNSIDQEQPVTVVKMLHRAYVDQVSALIGAEPEVNLLAALEDALTLIEARQLESWGALHRVRFITADDRVLVREITGGDDTSLNVAQVRCWDEDEQGDPVIAEHCTSTGGAVFRTVTTFDDDGTPRTVFNFAKGNGVPLSDWLDGIYKPWLFRTDEVRASAKSNVLTLEP